MNEVVKSNYLYYYLLIANINTGMLNKYELLEAYSSEGFR